MKLFSVILAAGLLGSGANAATISVLFQNQAGAGIRPENVYSFEASEDFTEATEVAFSADGQRSTEDFGSASVQGSIAVNSTTGEIKVGGRVSRDGPVNGGAGAQSYSNVFLTETFTLNGTGTLSALMLVDAAWSTNVGGAWYAAVGAFANSAFDVEDFSVLGGETPSGSIVNQPLVASVDITEAVDQFATLYWRLQSYVVADALYGPINESFIDILNTGTIFFSTTGSLTATPSARSFLSDPAYLDDIGGEDPSPVPLPASGLLLTLAVIGLRAFRARSRI